jgi:hypothetical protein
LKGFFPDKALFTAPKAAPSGLSIRSIADDAQGEQIEILWDAEVGASLLDEDTWAQVGTGAPDNPQVLAAHLRTLR